MTWLRTADLASIAAARKKGALISFDPNLRFPLWDSREELRKTVDNVLSIPDTHTIFKPSLGVIPLQIFSYYMALQRGCDIDKPRNLAKSVTVE